MAMDARMLLSHNCALPEDRVSTLSRDDFAAVFIDGLEAHEDIHCRPIENPHWMVEILFDADQKTPTAVADLCAQSLAARRSHESSGSSEAFTVMLLGGLKTTPPIGSSMTSLQPGQWGVDVVETFLPDQFLSALNWDSVIADKPPEHIFKVMQIVN